MPQMSEMKRQTNLNFFLYGNIGGGKTSLLRTIPGRKFVYMFDPAGLMSFRPTDDIFVEQFLPKGISMSVATLKGISDNQAPKYSAATTYVEFEKDFENRLSKNWFTDPSVEIDGVKGGFDVIGFDSFTTLSDLVMDRILEINNRSGKNPELSDYGVQTITLMRIVRNAASTGCCTVFTGHEKSSQDKLMRTVSKEILATGQLAQKLPILFSDIYHCKADRNAQGQPIYKIETVPTDMFPTMRCSMKLKPEEEVTFDVEAKDVTQFGLGKILREKGLWK